ncbi:MAG: 5-(carboxyamino)imidazole ribonucleotide mutase [Deltaproteobacteria bacterium]|nr:5-(carboxyamino)imidazole ribonucleotide mutase [Deltaproteobacteria bacterium]MBW2120642.1 5-(carboxyamino)imidazole ribonucleotide mutase [Deltaproteobacteria bacterium]
MKREGENPLVGIVMGSDSDLEVMAEAASSLESFGIPYEMTVASAHRSPDKVGRYAKSAVARGLEVIIAGAGGAAHLAGVLASQTLLPVIGVPVGSTALRGIDSLLSTVQMPGGVAVATMAIGRSGARNAGIMAAQILSLKYPWIRTRLQRYRNRMKRDVENKDKALGKAEK